MKFDEADLILRDVPLDMRRKIFRKARPLEGECKKVFAIDKCGTTIRVDQYGKDEEFGWHVAVVAGNMSFENIDNLFPLHVANVEKRAGIKNGCFPCADEKQVCLAEEIERLTS